ncbi:MAG: hypothetical protein J7604_24025 [Sporocytophaga sp.]|uniref:hypothetical protein n=1 Tax=Sporocytophaga sp. TaxID=2231183 RepID=UPI001AFD49B9|nr:hypothetical protein [Sporocytophaga sp.]MBO9703304.1 hypothetical protein [Sporocytophaga sp.]
MNNTGHDITTNEIVEFLSDCNNFPEHTNIVTLKETHMSYVFITDNFVYKMKKPVLYPFLNLSTLERRQHNCHKEITVNKALAPDIYLGVVPLSMTDIGLQLDGKGIVIEWFVKMKRLPDEAMLDYKLQKGEITNEEIISLGRKLSDFYKQTKKKELYENEYLQRLTDFLSDNLESLKHPSFEVSNEVLNEIKTLQLNFIEKNEQHLRLRASRIIEVHGDLKPEHICFLNEPVIIDALEFNSDFRIQDPVEELSYFSLECELLGNEWLGKKLLEIYENESKDHYYKGLEPFYKSIRATLRALSSFRHILDDHRKDILRWKLKGTDYLMRAQMYVSE